MSRSRPARCRVGDGLLERGHADAANGPADELAAGELVVDDPAAIGDRDDACDPQHAELGVDLDFGEARTEGAGGDRGVRGADELATEPSQTRHDERPHKHAGLRTRRRAVTVGGELVQPVPLEDLGIRLTARFIVAAR